MMNAIDLSEEQKAPHKKTRRGGKKRGAKQNRGNGGQVNPEVAYIEQEEYMVPIEH